MATKASARRETQEQSIKARKKELYVEEQRVESGPRKEFREYLRETPAVPLSKNVKLMLWGSAAPVVLLFLGALLTSKGSTAKPPSETVLPPSLQPPALSVAKVSDEHPPKETIAPKKESKVKPENPPEEKKSKPKSQKPADDSSPSGKAVAKTDKPAKNEDGTKEGQKEEAVAKTDKPAKNEDGTKEGQKEKMANQGPSTQEARDKSKTKDKPDTKSKVTDATPSPAPDKPKRSRIFKTKKAPVFTYPKREGEKKEEEKKEEKSDPGHARPSSGPDAGSSSP